MRQPAQARVAIEAISAGGVGDDAEEVLAAEIINPRQRRIGTGDDVFTVGVVKMSVGILRRVFGWQSGPRLKKVRHRAPAPSTSGRHVKATVLPRNREKRTDAGLRVQSSNHPDNILRPVEPSSLPKYADRNSLPSFKIECGIDAVFGWRCFTRVRSIRLGPPPRKGWAPITL